MHNLQEDRESEDDRRKKYVEGGGDVDVDRAIKGIFNVLKKKFMFPKFMDPLPGYSDKQAGLLLKPGFKHLYSRETTGALVLPGLLQRASLKDRTLGQERNLSNTRRTPGPDAGFPLGNKG